MAMEGAAATRNGGEPPPYDELGAGSSNNHQSNGNGNGNNGNGKHEDRRSTVGGSSMRSGSGSVSNLPPPFDVAELGSYGRGSQEVRYSLSISVVY